MQPRPMAETSKSLFPSLRFFIVFPSRQSLSSSPVLLVADPFHPVDGLAVEPLLDGDVRHRRRRRRTVPVLFVGRKPDDIAGVNFLDAPTPNLHPAVTGCDDQGLAQGMGVPCRSRPGLERDA